MTTSHTTIHYRDHAITVSEVPFDSSLIGGMPEHFALRIEIKTEEADNLFTGSFTRIYLSPKPKAIGMAIDGAKRWIDLLDPEVK